MKKLWLSPSLSSGNILSWASLLIRCESFNSEQYQTVLKLLYNTEAAYWPWCPLYVRIWWTDGLSASLPTRYSLLDNTSVDLLYENQQDSRSRYKPTLIFIWWIFHKLLVLVNSWKFKKISYKDQSLSTYRCFWIQSQNAGIVYFDVWSSPGLHKPAVKLILIAGWHSTNSPRR